MILRFNIVVDIPFQVLEEPIKAENGIVKAIEKPGLGVEINKKMFEENVLN